MAKKTKHQRYANFLRELSQSLQEEYNEKEMKDLVVLIRKRSPAIGNRSPNEVFDGFLAQVEALARVEVKPVIQKVRQVIADVPQKRLSEVVEYIDAKGWTTG